MIRVDRKRHIQQVSMGNHTNDPYFASAGPLIVSPAHQQVKKVARVSTTPRPHQSHLVMNPIFTTQTYNNQPSVQHLPTGHSGGNLDHSQWKQTEEVAYSGNLLTQNEFNFYNSINEHLPLTRNIRLAFDHNELDIGKAGVTILKYKDAQLVQSTDYEMCLADFSKFDVKVKWDVSELGELSNRVYQLGNTFYTNIRQKPKEPRSGKSELPVNFRQLFTPVVSTFCGSPPFKDNIVVDSRQFGRVPIDVQRCLSKLIRCVFLVILEDPNVIHDYGVRQIATVNAKTSKEELPPEVINFIKAFCLSCYGYPVGLQYASYTLEDLLKENPRMADRIGSKEEERKVNFARLVSDVYIFVDVVFAKLQRVVNDLRQYIAVDVGATNDANRFPKRWIRKNKCAVTTDDEEQDEGSKSPDDDVVNDDIDDGEE